MSKTFEWQWKERFLRALWQLPFARRPFLTTDVSKLVKSDPELKICAEYFKSTRGRGEIDCPRGVATSLSRVANYVFDGRMLERVETKGQRAVWEFVDVNCAEQKNLTDSRARD